MMAVCFMTTCAQKPDGEERGGVRVAVGNKMSIFSPAMLVNVFMGCWFLILPLREGRQYSCRVSCQGCFIW